VRRSVLLLLAFAMAAAVLGCGGGHHGDRTGWSITRNGDTLEIAYGSGTTYPQYAALHLDSGYFRMVWGPACGWGTSVVVLPSFWEGAHYYQGAPIQATWSSDGDTLVISFTGTIQQLEVSGTIAIAPPGRESIWADIEVDVEGTADLDDRPGEAFKPVMLSSMHVSSEIWDCRSAYAWRQSFDIPTDGSIVEPPTSATSLGLRGGTSAWKPNAPTVEVHFTGVNPISGYPIRGWVTASGDPNDDNVGLWASGDGVWHHWQYSVVTKLAEP
jgi:hypothetical protein